MWNLRSKHKLEVKVAVDDAVIAATAELNAAADRLEKVVFRAEAMNRALGQKIARAEDFARKKR